MNFDIARGDVAALPAAGRALELLPLAQGGTLTLACTDSDLKAAYRVLRDIMDYGYEHDQPQQVQLICADDAVLKAYRFQWNMWFAECKPHPES